MTSDARGMLTYGVIAAAIGLASCSGGGGGNVVSCDIVQGAMHYCEEASASSAPGNTGCPMLAGYTPGTGCSRTGVTGHCSSGPYTFYVYDASSSQTLARFCNGAPDAGAGKDTGAPKNNVPGSGTYLECTAQDSDGNISCQENNFPQMPYANVGCDFGTLYGPISYSPTDHCTVPTGPGFSCTYSLQGYSGIVYETNPKWSDPANWSAFESEYKVHRGLCAQLGGTSRAYNVSVNPDGTLVKPDAGATD